MGLGPGDGQYRFRRRNRLLNKAGFARVFARAEASSDRYFTVLARPAAALPESGWPGPARLGLAVSKKNCRLAVQRNRLKRIVRDSFRHHLILLKGIDIVVLARPPAAKAENQLLAAALDRHWRRVSQRCAKPPAC